MGETILEETPTYTFIEGIFSQAYHDPESGVRVERIRDSEVIEGKQKDGTPISLARPVVGAEDDNPHLKGKEFFEVDVRYRTADLDGEQPIEYEHGRFYSFTADGQVRQLVMQGPSIYISIGEGEQADIHEMIAGSDFTSSR